MTSRFITCYSFDYEFKYNGERKAQLNIANSTEEPSYLLPINCTFVEPISYNEDSEEIFFNEENNQWEIHEKILTGSFFNKTNGSLENKIFYSQISEYTTTIPPSINAGDSLSFNGEEWIITKGSITLKKELEDLKYIKYTEIEKKYSDSQWLDVINGINFTIQLKGEWYNTTLEKRKSCARARADKLCYVLIPGYYSSDPNKVMRKFEGVLPLSLIEILDIKWDLISLTNLRVKEKYINMLEAAESAEDVNNINITFQDVQELDLDSEISTYLNSESVSDSDKLFVENLKQNNIYFLFVELNTETSLENMYNLM